MDMEKWEKKEMNHLPKWGGGDLDIEKITKQINTTFQDHYYHKVIELLKRFTDITIVRSLTDIEWKQLADCISDWSLWGEFEKKMAQLKTNDLSCYIKRICHAWSSISAIHWWKNKEKYISINAIKTIIHLINKHNLILSDLWEENINKILQSLEIMIQCHVRKYIISPTKWDRSSQKQLEQIVYDDLTHYKKLNKRRITTNRQKVLWTNHWLDEEWLKNTIHKALSTLWLESMISSMEQRTTNNSDELWSIYQQFLHLRTPEHPTKEYIDQRCAIMKSKIGNKEYEIIIKFYKQCHKHNYWTKKLIRNTQSHKWNNNHGWRLKTHKENNWDHESIAEYIFNQTNYGNDLLDLTYYDNIINHQTPDQQSLFHYNFEQNWSILRNFYSEEEVMNILYLTLLKTIKRYATLFTTNEDQNWRLNLFKKLQSAYERLPYSPKEVIDFENIIKQTDILLIQRISSYYNKLTQILQQNNKYNIEYYRKNFFKTSDYQKTLMYTIQLRSSQLWDHEELYKNLQSLKEIIMQNITYIRRKQHKIAILRELILQYQKRSTLDKQEMINQKITIITSKYRTQLENNRTNTIWWKDNIHYMVKILEQELQRWINITPLTNRNQILLPI